jgi:choline transport protein
VGWQSGTAAGSLLTAQMTQGLVVLSNPDYSPTRWQGTLITMAVIAFAGFMNTIMVKWLPKFEGLNMCVHVLGFFGVLIPLVYLAPHSSASDVFTVFLNGGGWSSDGLSFFIGLTTSVFPLLGKIDPHLPFLVADTPQELIALAIVRNFFFTTQFSDH